jgi:hypothetical protein
MRQKILPVLAHPFNGHGYNTLAQEYVVNFMISMGVLWARGGVVVKALRYKPEGHGFDSRWFHWNFSVT